MSENVGEIYYDIDAETGNLIIAQKDVERATKAMGDSFKRLESQQTKSSKAVADGLANMGRKAGQAGIQIQQFVGQVTTGTAPLVALSQQAADLGIVLSAPLLGAVIGIASALGTVLLPSLFASESATDALAKAVAELDKVARKSDGGIIAFGERIDDLAQISKTAAIAEIQAALVKADQAASSAAKSIGDILSGLDANYGLNNIQDIVEKNSLAILSGQAFDYANAVKKVSIEVGQEFGLVENAAEEAGRKLLVAIKVASKEKTPEAFKDLQVLLADMIAESPKASKSIKLLNSELVEVFANAQSAGERADFLRQKLQELSSETGVEKITENTEDAVRVSERLRQQLEIIKTKIKDGDAAARKLAASFELGLKTVEKLPPEIDYLIDEMSSIEATQKFNELTRSFEDQIDKLAMTSAEYAQYNAIKQLGADATPDQIVQIEALTEALVRQQEEVKAAKDKAKQDEKDTQLLKTLGVSPEVMAQQETNRQLQELDRLKKEGDLASEEDYINRRNEIVRQGNEKLDKINETVKGIDWESFSNRAAGAFALVATGAQDGRDAVRGLAQSIATEAIGALVKMLYQSIIGQKAAEAAGVATGSTLATAYAPAAALASLASFGANSAPASAGILATVGVANAAALSSGRLNGGPVAAGRLYPVNEDGRPELLTQGNKQYLMPTSRGNVTSNKDLSAGSQPVININISTPPGMTSEVRQTQSGGAQDIDVTIRAVANDIEEGGQVYQAMQRRTRAGTRAS